MTRIADKPLAELCHRWSVSESSGIDVRRSWQREAAAAPRRHRDAFQQICDAVASGDSVSQAVAATGRFFPPLFVALVAVGDKTGKLPVVLKRLSTHYENRVKLRREFIASITWPAMQLVAAVLIVGFVIWILGVISDSKGSEPIDLLGLGLVGNRGLLIYFATIAGVVACGYGFYRLLRSDLIWFGSLQRLVLRIPVLGKALETMAISRLAWSLGLALEAGMEIKLAVQLAMDAAQNIVFREQTKQVVEQIAAGSDLTLALASTNKFSAEFITTVEVGEHSGNLAETLLRLSDQYQEKARASLATLTKIAGFAVWAIVAVLIGAMIIQMVSQVYIKPLNDAIRMTQ